MKILTKNLSILLLTPFLIQTANAQEPIAIGLAERVDAFYGWAIGIGAVVALAIMIYGGVLYSASAGNPSGIEEAKKWIQHALFGLGLLLASFLILNTINPELTRLEQIFLDPNPRSDVRSPEPGFFTEIIRDVGELIGGLIDADSIELAGALLDRYHNPNDSHYSGDGRLTLYRQHPRTWALEPASRGELARVDAENTSITSTGVSSSLLRLLIAALESGHKIDLGRITSGLHSSTSQHYKGQAVDIITVREYTDDEKEALYRWIYDNREVLCVSSLIHNFDGEVTCSRKGRNQNTGTRPPGTTNMINGGPGNQNTDCHDQHIHVSVKPSCSPTYQLEGEDNSPSGGGGATPNYVI